MNSILEKEVIYRQQMAPILETVMRFADPRGWTKTHRGRKANASIHGPVHDFNGAMDIIMEDYDWDKMPEALTAETPFCLFCGAWRDRESGRYSADLELYWQVPFGELPRYINRYLAAAWEMLQGLTAEDCVVQEKGRALNPWMPPDFGPPRKRSAMTS